MAQRKLRIIGDDILRKQSRKVTELSDRIRLILEDMAETMYAEKGLGLAAPQVGVLKRLVVIDMHDGNGLMKLVNPVITEQAGLQECEEGCLSVPDRFGKTFRPQSVTVCALNENGKEITVKGEGDLAKCLCHEIDHLDGILFVDHMIEEE